MRTERKIKPENFERLCWEAGYEGPAGLARHINRHRVTVHRAVRKPKQYGPTFAKIQEALCA